MRRKIIENDQERLNRRDSNDFEDAKSDTRCPRRLLAALRQPLRLAQVMAAAGLAGLLLLLLRSGSGGSSFLSEGGAAGVAAHLAPPTCPLTYERLTFREVKNGARPYLFGGRQRPNCTNCDKDHLWSHFCQFKSHGQLCTPKDSDWLITTYIQRNWTQLLTLTPCDFWPYLEGRTLWVMGDSQSLDLYKALKCFTYEFWDLETESVPLDDPEVLPLLSKLLTPTCVFLPRRTRICYVRFDPADYLLDTLLPAFPRYGSTRDIMVVNFGLHHGNRTQYEGKMLEFVQYVDANRRRLPTVLWQQTTPQHFTGNHGEYPGGSPPFDCVPLPGGLKLQPDGTLTVEDEEQYGVLLHGGWRNQVAAEILHGSGVTIVPSYNETAPLYYYHRDNGKGYECTHYCFPSAQQTWVFALYRALLLHYSGKLIDPTTPFQDEPGVMA